jgi:hypothetical protein
VRAKSAPVALALLLAVTGCGSGSDNPPTGGHPNGDLPIGGDLNTTVPACPFTAQQVSQFVGQSMVDKGDCLFGDGKGVASVTITMSSQLAGSSTFDYKRKDADKRYDKAADVQKGDKAYVAAKELEGEAMLISKGGSYTLTLSSFDFDAAKYEQALRAMLYAIPT